MVKVTYLQNEEEMGKHEQGSSTQDGVQEGKRAAVTQRDSKGRGGRTPECRKTEDKQGVKRSAANKDRGRGRERDEQKEDKQQAANAGAYVISLILLAFILSLDR